MNSANHGAAEALTHAGTPHGAKNMALVTTFEYSASYEFDDGPPLTVRGRVDARQYHLATKRALVALRQQYPGRRPRSLVVVLQVLERPRPAMAQREATRSRNPLTESSETGPGTVMEPSH